MLKREFLENKIKNPELPNPASENTKNQKIGIKVFLLVEKAVSGKQKTKIVNSQIPRQKIRKISDLPALTAF